MQLERNGFGLPPALVVSLRGPETDPSGAVIESSTLTPADISPPPGSLEMFPSSLHCVLSAGSTYWLRAESSGPFPFESYGWAQNVTGDAGAAAVSLNAGASSGCGRAQSCDRSDHGVDRNCRTGIEGFTDPGIACSNAPACCIVKASWTKPARSPRFTVCRKQRQGSTSLPTAFTGSAPGSPCSPSAAPRAPAA